MMGSFDGECTCHLAGCNFTEVLGLAPCPPPFFYNEFEEYASSQGLCREEVCEIASRCMSRYQTESSSQIIKSTCFPHTTTTTTPTTIPTSTATTSPTTIPTSITTTSTTTTTANITTTTAPPSTPTSTPLPPPTTTPKPTPEYVIIVVAIVVSLALLILLAVIIVCFKRRGKASFNISQIRKYFGRMCKGGKEDQKGLVSNCHQEITVFYQNSSEFVVMHMEKNTKTDYNCTTSTVDIHALAHAQDGGTVECIDSVEAPKENFEDNFGYCESDESDYTENSSDDDTQPKIKDIYSETNSLKTQISSTLELQDNWGGRNSTCIAQTESHEPDENENVEAEACEPENFKNDNIDTSGTLQVKSEGEMPIKTENTCDKAFENTAADSVTATSAEQEVKGSVQLDVQESAEKVKDDYVVTPNDVQIQESGHGEDNNAIAEISFLQSLPIDTDISKNAVKDTSVA